MKRSAKACLVVLLLLLAAAQRDAHAQLPELINDRKFRPAAQAAVDSIYNFNFDGAQRTLSPWKKQYPDHPLWMLIDGMQLWWQVLSDLESKTHDEEFFYRMKRTDYAASQLLRDNSSHADGLIIKTVANGYIARQYANREEWLSSINTARKALSSYNYLRELQPELSDLNLAEGLKYYYAAYLPEAYPIVKTVSWFLPEGDKEKGMGLMREASEKAIFARAEATYFLGNINYNYQQEYDRAVNYFEDLYLTYPNNNYYVRKLVSSLYQLNRYDRALEIIDESLDRWTANKLPFEKVLQEELLTWKGRIFIEKSNAPEALLCFKKAFEIGKDLPGTNERTFHIISGYYLGKLYYENTEYSMAKRFLKEITSSNAKDSRAYQKAAKELLENLPTD